MTRRGRTVLLGMAALCCQAGQHPSLARIEAVPGMERRSRQALAFASTQLQRAVDAYRAGNLELGQHELEGLVQAVEMAVDSLEATGKHPRRHPRHFKHAEIRTRKLLQQLRRAQSNAHLEDQDDFEGPIRKVERANGKLLLGIMSPRK